MRLLSGSARLAGVIGWPVSHSRSPRLHGTWLNRHDIDGAYLPLPVGPADLAQLVPALAKTGFAGLNVTIPHKISVMALCDRIDPGAARIGAVNTLVFTETGIEGFNTDGYGFIANLRAHGVNPAAGPALILGAGGAARAVAAALQDEGTPVTFCNRTERNAIALAAALPPGNVLPWEYRSAALGDYALLVNTTSLGMVHHEPLDISLEAATAALAVADIVYAPLETELLKTARALGLAAVEGLGMLLHQAVPGFKAWFGVTPEVDDELYRIVSGG
ncbi:shikimate dehydrogenase (NADP(+)) [Acidocella aquatica]|uniref:Shikimate dehydrogenase (NADP(+)) n=1 Tax=Acidocella aquatica TaxID=1922313 RepID=A0ABQ6A3P7_9PROT|nr:shikimate dehydrogenase [Acidocella aquatica]GLR66799.1 shikimate dehydrogenase (NADP(+)) [Acidocella aquatica]